MLDYFPQLDGSYIAAEKYKWYSARYGETITIRKGEVSDGATKATDIISAAWFLHDMACKRGKWDSGRPITALQAAMILHDVLRKEARLIREMGQFRRGAWRFLQSLYWPVGTFIGGCVKTRKNGWFKEKQK